MTRARGHLAGVACALLLAGSAAWVAGACTDERAPTARAGAGADPSQQPFDEAMRILCDAPDRAEIAPEASAPANRAMLIAAWIDSRVQNREVRELMGGLAAETPAGKLEALRAGARRAGIQRCALADFWQVLAGPKPAR